MRLVFIAVFIVLFAFEKLTQDASTELGVRGGLAWVAWAFGRRRLQVAKLVGQAWNLVADATLEYAALYESLLWNVVVVLWDQIV